MAPPAHSVKRQLGSFGEHLSRHCEVKLHATWQLAAPVQSTEHEERRSQLAVQLFALRQSTSHVLPRSQLESHAPA
jgi:hypothetical protein